MENILTKTFLFSLSHLLNLAHYTVTLILAQRKGRKQGQESAARDSFHQHSCSKKRVSRPICGGANVLTAVHCFSISRDAETMRPEAYTLFPSYQNGLVKKLTIPFPFKEKLTFS